MEESERQRKRYPLREAGQKRVQEEEEALEEKHLRQITKHTV